MHHIFISPHDDDQVLFGAFTLQQHPGALVVIVFDSYNQSNRGLPVTAAQRMAESTAANKLLGCWATARLGFRDDDANVTPSQVATKLSQVIEAWSGEKEHHLYLPAVEEGGNVGHNLVGQITPVRNCTRYLTYTERGKSTSEKPVPIYSGYWIKNKLEALACFDSQFSMDPRMGCWPHFMRDQTEYYL